MEGMAIKIKIIIGMIVQIISMECPCRRWWLINLLKVKDIIM